MMIPAATSAGTVVVTDPSSLFKNDVALTFDGHLGDDGLGDFNVAAGVPNLNQALVNRILVERGELNFHLTYGCGVRKLIGKKATPALYGLAARYVRQTLLEDPRVVKVTDVQVSIVGDAMAVSAQCEAISGISIPVKVTL